MTAIAGLASEPLARVRWPTAEPTGGDPMSMSDRRPFVHNFGCKILATDPGVEIAWSEIEPGLWEATCVCGKAYFRDPLAAPPRLDPFDPKTSRHAGQCEYRDTIDPELLRLVLSVKDGLEPGYWWVECRSCKLAWQVLHHAAGSGG
jgi:hypothetical protein